MAFLTHRYVLDCSFVDDYRVDYIRPIYHVFLHDGNMQFTIEHTLYTEAMKVNILVSMTAMDMYAIKDM